MISGREALGGIERSIATERAAVQETEQRLEKLLREEESLRKANLEDYRKLARLRLNDLVQGEVVGRLDRIDRQAVAILSERDRARAELEQRIAKLDAELAALAGEREERSLALDAAKAEIEAAEQRTRGQLADDAAYTAQAERVRKIDIQAANADQKATQSEQELASKRAAYEDNALFMYLWKRGFGTPSYAAFPLFRQLDKWVARLVGYDDARANYFRLQEIPKRLREHAARLGAEADAEEAQLAELWRTARTAAGSATLDAALETTEAELEAADARVQEATETRNGLLEERGRYASGEDERTTAAVDLLAEELRRADLSRLFRDARETLRTEDDQIVSALIARQREVDGLAATRSQLKETLARRLQRMKELADISSEFKRRRYARSDSAFRDGALISILLRDLLDGGLARDTFWDELAHQQRWNPRSSGPQVGFTRPGGLGRPMRRTGGFGGGIRPSGGGFRTGGGF